MTHHSLRVHKEEVLLVVVLHPRQDVLTHCALGFPHQEVPVLQDRYMVGHTSNNFSIAFHFINFSELKFENPLTEQAI